MDVEPYREVLYGGELSKNFPPLVNVNDILKFSSPDNMHFSISDEILGRHILITGGTGSGKTNLFLQCTAQLKAQMTHEDVMIIFDAKGDYFKAFYNSAKDLVIGCSPEYKNHSQKWNIFREIMIDGSDDEDTLIVNTQEICRTLFAESLQRSKDIFFPNAARALMSAVIINAIRAHKSGLISIEKLNNRTLRGVLNTSTAEELSDMLLEYDDTRSKAQYIANGTEQAQGVLSEMYSSVGDVFISMFGDDGIFSVRDFVRKRGGRILFIEYDLASGDTLSPVYSILMDLALKEILSRNSSNSAGRVYLILDELKLLPYLHHFDDGINFGRSLGLRIIAGLQSTDQLNAVYKENPAAARNIISGFSSTIAFRPSDSATRSYIRELHGRKIILEQFPQLTGMLDNIRTEGNVVEDWDLIKLSKGEAVIGLLGVPPFKFKFSRY